MNISAEKSLKLQKSIATVLLFSMVALATWFFRDKIFSKPLLRGPFVENFTLFSLKKQAFRFHENQDKRGVVFFVYSSGCPIVQQQIPYLRKLRNKYQEKGIDFYLLLSDFNINLKKLRESLKLFEVDFPILIDDAQSVANLLKINRTAETLLFDTKSSTIAYRGALNDRFNYGGQKIEHISFLDHALENLLNYGSATSITSQAKGCLLYKPTQPASDEISYNRDIVPIVQKHCLSCHTEGGRAPWAMTSFEVLANWSKMMSEVIITKRDPPHVVFTDAGHFKDPTVSGLTPLHERTLLTWLSQPTGPQENENDSLIPAHAAAKKNQASWPWGPPDLIVKFDEEPQVEIPESGWVKWQLKFKKFIPEDRWIKAAYIKTKNEQALHHISIWSEILNPEQQIQSNAYVKKREWINNPIIKKMIREKKFDWSSDLGQMTQLKTDSLIDPSSYSGKWLEGVTKDPVHANYSLLSSYSSSRQRPFFPKSTGRLIPAGATLRALMHYKTIGRKVYDTPSVGFYFYKKSERPKNSLHFQFLQGNHFAIEKNQKKTVKFYHVVERPIRLYGVASHLHYRGRSQKILLHTRSGETKTLLHQPNYQYDTNIWSNPLKEPLDIARGSVIESIAQMDNTHHNPYNPDSSKDQKFGFQLEEEMIWASIDFTYL